MSTLEALWPNMILLHTAGFTRGSARFPNESPVRRVPLSPYLIDRLPVKDNGKVDREAVLRLFAP